MINKKYPALLFFLLLFSACSLAGCKGSTNTIEAYLISPEQYSDKADLEGAVPPDQYESGKDIYANIYFIESPKGMEYTARWTQNDNKLKIETKKMETDKQGMMIFTLEADNVNTGTILFEVLYDEEVLLSKELPVK